LILIICNQFIAIPFTHNTTQHNTTQHNTTQHNTTQHNSTQHNTVLYNHYQTAFTEVFSATDCFLNQKSVIPPVCSAATFMNRPAVQSCSHPHDICNKRKMFSPQTDSNFATDPLAVKWYISLWCCDLL